MSNVSDLDLSGIPTDLHAKILSQALPYIREYSGKILVIKYGGNAMINEELKADVMEDIVLLSQIGVQVVLVHGGGPEITETLKKMQIPSVFVDGLRKTDEATMQVVQMVLAGKLNKDLVNRIHSAGGRAMGLCGVDGHMLECKPLRADLGYVGEIVKIDPSPVLDALNAGYIPVIATVGCDAEGHTYNINADTVAASLSGALKAFAMISMTDTRGILRDVNDPDSLIPEIRVSEVPAYFQDGIISGGMIPKIECCVEAIRRGVRHCVIIDGRIPHALLLEILTDRGIGTLFK
ncbi:MAG: acetylglutamate kinase [Clostridia bacterium]|nr:acetylglutamate kinase [Clostridia bacterium]